MATPVPVTVPEVVTATPVPAATPRSATATPIPTTIVPTTQTIDFEVEAPAISLAILEGKAEYRTSSSGEWLGAFDAQPLEQGWEVRTLAVSTAVIEFSDGSRVRMAPVTEVAIDLYQLIDGGPPTGEHHARVRLINGDVDFDISDAPSPPSTWVFATTDAAVTIQGTQGSLGRRISLAGDGEADPGVQLEVDFNIELLDGTATLARVAPDPETGEQDIQALVLSPGNGFSHTSVQDIPSNLFETASSFDPVVEVAPPVMIGEAVIDTDGNGVIDAINLVFSEDIAFAARRGIGALIDGIGDPGDSVRLQRGLGSNQPVELAGTEFRPSFGTDLGSEQQNVDIETGSRGPFGLLGQVEIQTRGGVDRLIVVTILGQSIEPTEGSDFHQKSEAANATGAPGTGVSWRRATTDSPNIDAGDPSAIDDALDFLAGLDVLALGGPASVQELLGGASLGEAQRMAVSNLSSSSDGAKLGAGFIGFEDIPGTSQEKGVDDSIELLFFEDSVESARESGDGTATGRREHGEVSLTKDVSEMSDVDDLTGKRPSLGGLIHRFELAFGRPQAQPLFDEDGNQIGLKLPDEIVFDPNGTPVGKKIGDILATDGDGTELPEGVVPDVFYVPNPDGEDMLHATTILNQFIPKRPAVKGDTNLDTVEVLPLVTFDADGVLVPTIFQFDERGRPVGTVPKTDQLLDENGDPIDNPDIPILVFDDAGRVQDHRAMPFFGRGDDGEILEFEVPRPIAHDENGNQIGLTTPCKISKGDLGISGIEISGIIEKEWFVSIAEAFVDRLEAVDVARGIDVPLVDIFAEDRGKFILDDLQVVFDAEGRAHTTHEFRPEQLFRDDVTGEITGKRTLTSFHCLNQDCFEQAAGNESLLDKFEETIRVFTMTDDGQEVVAEIQGETLLTSEGHFAGFIPPPIQLLGFSFDGFAEVTGFAAAEAKIFQQIELEFGGKAEFGFAIADLGGFGGTRDLSLHRRGDDGGIGDILDLAFEFDASAPDGSFSATFEFTASPNGEGEDDFRNAKFVGGHLGGRILDTLADGAPPPESIGVEFFHDFGAAFGQDFAFESRPGSDFFARIEDAQREQQDILREFFDSKADLFFAAHDGGQIDAAAGFGGHFEDGEGFAGGLPFDPSIVFDAGDGTAGGPPFGDDFSADILDRFNQASDDAAAHEGAFGGFVDFGGGFDDGFDPSRPPDDGAFPDGGGSPDDGGFDDPGFVDGPPPPDDGPPPPPPLTL